MNHREKNLSLATTNKNSQVDISKVNFKNHKMLFEKEVAKETNDWELRQILMGLYSSRINVRNIHKYYQHPMRKFLIYLTNDKLSELEKETSVFIKEPIIKNATRKNTPNR